jgi:hypothetical protein
VQHLWLKDKSEGSTILAAASSVLLRVALGFSFLWAIADRFGLWGAFGEPCAMGKVRQICSIYGTTQGFVEPSDMLAELREDNQSLAAWLREVHNVCEEHPDSALRV